MALVVEGRPDVAIDLTGMVHNIHVLALSTGSTLAALWHYAILTFHMPLPSLIPYYNIHRWSYQVKRHAHHHQRGSCLQDKDRISCAEGDRSWSKILPKLSQEGNKRYVCVCVCVCDLKFKINIALGPPNPRC